MTLGIDGTSFSSGKVSTERGQPHQRFTFHFSPTSCSWANRVEGLFAKLTRHRLKPVVFTSIVEL